MKILVSGHRTSKLANYDLIRINELVDMSISLLKQKYGYIIGLSGMANGIDLEYCDICINNDVRYYACPSFEEQANYMSIEEQERRKQLIDKAEKVFKVRNSEMLSMSDKGIIVWDGNKGGTHNVFQQMLENKKGFIWIEPKSLNLYEIGDI